jgi:hypothetical protein
MWIVSWKRHEPAIVAQASAWLQPAVPMSGTRFVAVAGTRGGSRVFAGPKPTRHHPSQHIRGRHPSILRDNTNFVIDGISDRDPRVGFVLETGIPGEGPTNNRARFFKTVRHSITALKLTGTRLWYVP